MEQFANKDIEVNILTQIPSFSTTKKELFRAPFVIYESPLQTTLSLSHAILTSAAWQFSIDYFHFLWYNLISYDLTRNKIKRK